MTPEQLEREEPSNMIYKTKPTNQTTAFHQLFGMSHETVLLEELQTADRHHDAAAKVDKVHLHLRRAGDVMDDGPVEPQSFGRHAADLAPTDKRLGKTVRLGNLWKVVASSW